MGTALRVLGRRGVYMKSAETLERTALVDTVVFDKTGTLTAAGANSARFEGKPLSTKEAEWIYSLAMHSTHPHVRRPIHQNKWESTAAAKFRRAKILDTGTGFLATGLHYFRGGDAVVPDDYHHFHNGIWAALVWMGVPADGADGNGFPETGIFN